jgi:hypothetical protein
VQLWKECFHLKQCLQLLEIQCLVSILLNYLTGVQSNDNFSVAEHAEKIGYNALPATITPDMWAHQYLQEVNEANAVIIDHHVWASDGPDAILYAISFHIQFIYC